MVLMNVKALVKHSSGSLVGRKYGATRIKSLDMIEDESLDIIVDESLIVEDKSHEKLVDETLKLDEEDFEFVIADREERQVPIYFISRVLQGTELDYPALEKLILSLVHATRRLRRYFQSHHELGPSKTKIPKDFSIEMPPKEGKRIAARREDTKKGSKLINTWKLYNDEASNSDGSRAYVDQP
ncbi:putative reverse transcriptase domain, ribonuclease H-like domain protein [Tanacetum coccineum]